MGQLVIIMLVLAPSRLTIRHVLSTLLTLTFGEFTGTLGVVMLSRLLCPSSVSIRLVGIRFLMNPLPTNVAR